MFRLIKLALYALVGYALYELYQGMVQGGGTRGTMGGRQQGGGQQGGQQGERFGERLNIGAAQNMTGGGGGMTERTEEPAGTSVPHPVGRGVVG